MEDEIFKNIFSKDVLTIPKRWEGDFKEIFINDLNAYIESLVEFAVEDETLENLRIIIRKLDISLEEYFKGNIAKSYQCFSSIMDDFYNTEINSGFEKF
ncbi:hypothetical protein [Fundicoccus ignavus]|uniref:CdiI immunity protein domain-containing protein n=1 Tax=Fundicoccus ignavus TaxID=2664442 RepID=A0A844C8V8_9LACT|nr:hypothetical protein [Fundicoccus ignavus]MRJ46897.1 hypothetical protein [Fundicoccus ignavus]